MKIAAINRSMQLLFCCVVCIVILSVSVSAQLPNFTNPTNFSVVTSSQLKGYYSYQLINTSDGGALYSGSIDSNNAILIKLSSSGSIQWEKNLNKDSSISLTSISEVENGNFLACGYIHGTGNFEYPALGILYATLLDKDGSIVWRMPLNPDTTYMRYTKDYSPIIKNQKGDYVLLTSLLTNPVTSNVPIVLHFYDSNAVLKKEVNCDSLIGRNIGAYPFIQTNDKGFAALLHYSIGVKTYQQLWRFDSNGTVLWKKEFQDVPYSEHGGWSSMVEAQGGGFFVATTASAIGTADTSFIMLRRFDDKGNEFVKKKLGMRHFNAVAQIKQTPNQDIVMIGYGYNREGFGDDISQYTKTDMCLFRISQAGKLRWQEVFGDTTTADYGQSIAVVDNNTFYIGGGTGKTSSSTSPKPVVFKITDLISDVQEQPETSNSISIYPNPTSTSFTVSGVEGVSSVRIVNSLGMEVISNQSISNMQEVDVSNLPNGLYFVSVRNASGTIVKPIVISQ